MGGAVAGWATGTILELKLEAYASTLGRPVEELTKPEKAAALLPGYHLNFYIFAAVYGVAVVLWLLFDSTKPVVPDTRISEG